MAAPIQKVNRILRCLTDCNQALIRCESETELLDQICDIIVEKGGYSLCWVGFKDNTPEKLVIPAAQKGFQKGYLSEIKVSYGDDEYGSGPTGMAIKTGQFQVNRKTTDNVHYHPWQKAAQERGFESSIAFPLKFQTDILGALNVYSDIEGVFDKDEIELLQELADDLAYGLRNLRIVQQLKMKESKYRMIFNYSSDAIFIADLNGKYRLVNDSGVEMLGYSREKLLQMKMTEVLIPEETAAKPVKYSDMLEGRVAVNRRQLLKADGTILQAEILGTQLPDGSLMGIVRDIESFQKNEKLLESMAFSDPIIGLPNRHHFHKVIEQTQEGASELLNAAAIINLDHFYRINTAWGRETGLVVLKAVGNRIRAAAQHLDWFAYAGQDEFYLLFQDEDKSKVNVRVHKIQALLREPIHIRGLSISVTASIGMVDLSQYRGSTPMLINRLHNIIGHAKKMGLESLLWYDQKLKDTTKKNLEKEQQISAAIISGRFVSYYQAKYKISDNSIAGYEALVRMNNADQIILPSEFIPLAESTGMIHGIGKWVLNDICKTLSSSFFLQNPTKIAVNISSLQFQKQDFPDLLNTILDTHGISPTLIELELTESILFQDPEAAADRLNDLKDAGFTITIDDFGTGYSSLGLIRNIPIDNIKIDRSFIANITTKPKDSALVKTIISMGKNLGLTVIAEGIETEEQLDILKELGCDQAQGFLLSHPLPLESIPLNKI